MTDLRRFFVEIQLKSRVVFSRHDLRRTFITMAEKLDVPHLIIRRLANHQANTDITSNYIIVDPERLREPVNRIGNQFVRLMGADIDNLFLWRRSDNETSDGSQLRLGISLHAPKS